MGNLKQVEACRTLYDQWLTLLILTSRCSTLAAAKRSVSTADGDSCVSRETQVKKRISYHKSRCPAKVSQKQMRVRRFLAGETCNMSYMIEAFSISTPIHVEAPQTIYATQVYARFNACNLGLLRSVSKTPSNNEYHLSDIRSKGTGW